MRYIRFCIFVLATSLISSCLIENDMSYPRVSADIIAFEVEGQKSADIDVKARTVNVELSETAEMSNLRLVSFELSEGARCENLSADMYIDLTTPMSVTVSTYHDYEWTISATQNIERYVDIVGQIGEADINLDERYVMATVSDLQPRNSIVINGMKLEPLGAEIIGYLPLDDDKEIIPADFPLTLDCTLSRKFIIEYKGEKHTWILDIKSVKVETSINSVDPWCYHADVVASYDGNGSPHLEYRADGESSWTAFEDVTVSGLDIAGAITGLKEGTDYYVRVVCGDSTSEEYHFKTGIPVQIENMNFDAWYSEQKLNKDIWYPNLDNTYNIWGTANPASGAFIGSLTTPEETFVAASGEGKRAARLESKNAVIAFAAGNLFTGEFVKINGVGAILDWGVPFTGRPAALKGYYAYNPVKIDYAKAPYEDLKGTMDKCQIFVILTDWTGPFTVDTKAGVFVDQTKENDSIIAYGKLESAEDTGDSYREFTVELEYWRKGEIPSYAVVVACSSYKGDFFTGGVGSVLYVDEFEFVYD